MLFGKDKAQVEHKKKLFMDKWKCGDLGEVKEFLHMHITHKNQVVMLDQCAYLDKVLERFSMTNAKSVPTHLPRYLKLLKAKPPQNYLGAFRELLAHSHI